MASLAQPNLAPSVGDERFFLRSAILMALLVAAAFSFQLAMGRSTFASPVRVHVHALLFMGWVTIYVLQNILVSTGRMGLHRRLGWIAAAWAAAMVVSGFIVTGAMTRAGTVPFFFTPLHFLIFNPTTLLTFAALTAAAIVMRRRTEWHRRLHLCGMAMLIAPAFGRLLPLPLITPFAWEATFVGGLLFPLAGMWRDLRREGRIHRAWVWGVGVMLTAFVLIQAVSSSPLGAAIYDRVTAGSPGASIDPLAYPLPPAGPLMTGRSE